MFEKRNLLQGWRRKAGAVAAVSLLVTSCVVATSASGAPKAMFKFTPVTPGVLTIATEIGNPGWVNGTSPTHLTGGVEYHIGLQLAKDFGLKAEFRNVSFTPLVSGVVSGYDVGLMTIFNTPARQKVNKYSKCYYGAYTGGLVGNNTPLATLADAQAIKWGYVTGGFAGLILNGLKPTQAPLSFSNGPEEYAALASGEIQGVMDDLSSIAGRAAEAPLKGNDTVKAVFNLENAGFQACSAAQLPKQSPSQNLKSVNQALTLMLTDGQIKKWEAQYLAPLGQNPNAYAQINVNAAQS
jgi:polar amino acid transport system substrate-binding protein